MINQNDNDHVAPIEDEVLDTSVGDFQRKPGMSPAAKFGLIAGGGIGAVALALMLAGPQGGAETQLTRPPSLDATPGGSTQATSVEFQENIRQENERRASMAANLGVTSMPTPEVILQPVSRVETVPEMPEIERREPAPAPAAQVQPVSRRILSAPDAAPRVTPQPEVQAAQAVEPAPAPQPAAAAPQEEEENRFVNAMISQMGMISQRQTPIGLASSSVASVDRQDRAAAPDAQVPSGEEQPGEIIMRPGDILYGETLTSVSSDARAPVLVEIVSGNYRGARMVGTFTADRRSETMVVNFTNMTLADGTTVDIEAYAVDGRSAETAVASDVERRYLQRYGPVLAATFLSSFAQAAAQPERIVTGTGQDRDVILSAPTARQAGFAGLAAATDVIASDIMHGVPVGAKINLRAGYPIAVLIVEPVVIPQASTQPN